MSGSCSPKLLKTGACCGSVGVWAAADGVELGLGGFLEAQLCAASSNLQNSKNAQRCALIGYTFTVISAIH